MYSARIPVTSSIPYICEMSKNSRKITYEVPAEGSLGLLALGSVGLRAWRAAKRKKAEEEKHEE